MNREDIIKLASTALIFPVVFLLLAYFNGNEHISIMSFTAYFLLALVGTSIGAVYAHYAHSFFFKNSFIAGFVPSLVLMFIAINMGIDGLIALGDLCLIISCWTAASEIAFSKNKSLSNN